MTYGDFKDLPRRTTSEALNIKAFTIVKNLKYDGYQRGLASVIYKCFDKKSTLLANKFVSVGGIKTKIMSNQELAENRNLYPSFKSNIWGAHHAVMQLRSKFNKGICFLLFVIDIFSKYAWVFPFKNIKGIRIINDLQNIINKSGRKTNKLRVDEGSKFYNRSAKSWLQDNDIEMHSIHNERKSVVAERFIRTLKNKIYKYMTSISKNFVCW